MNAVSWPRADSRFLPTKLDDLLIADVFSREPCCIGRGGIAGQLTLYNSNFFNDSRWTFESIRCCWEVAFSEVPDQMEQNLFIWVFRLIVAVFLVFWINLVELFRVSTIFFKMRSDLIETKTVLLRFSLMLLERLVSDYIERIQGRKTRRRQRNQKN